MRVNFVLNVEHKFKDMFLLLSTLDDLEHMVSVPIVSPLSALGQL